MSLRASEDQMDIAIKCFEDYHKRTEPNADPCAHPLASGLLALARGLQQVSDEFVELRWWDRTVTDASGNSAMAILLKENGLGGLERADRVDDRPARDLELLSKCQSLGAVSLGQIQIETV